MIKKRKCLECELFFEPKVLGQRICSDICKAERLKKQHKKHYLINKDSLSYKLSNYRASAKQSIKKWSEEKLFRKANNAVILLELIDEKLKSKFGKTLEMKCDEQKKLGGKE